MRGMVFLATPAIFRRINETRNILTRLADGFRTCGLRAEGYETAEGREGFG